MEAVRKSREAGLMPKSVASIKQSARERSLPGLEIEPALDTPMGFKFEGADVKEAYKTLGLVVGVNFVFESGVTASPVTLELKDAPFEQALKALSMASKTFTRVIGPRLIQVIPDTPSKRRDYEDQIVKTFYLSTAELKEVVDVLRISLGARRVAPLAGGNALTMNDTPEKIAAAERIIEALDKRHGEVVVDVEILEVNRKKLMDYGIEINSINGVALGSASLVPGVSGGAFPDPSKVTTLDSNPYQKSNIIVSGLPGVVYRLLQTDGSSRLLANPQLRVTEGQTATARFGDQVPVPVTTFAAIATGGVAQQPITSFEYKSIGVNIDITPRVHHDGDITLLLKLEISSMGAPGYAGLPTFSTRTVTSTLRLRDGETSILAGLITDRESTSLSGLPGLCQHPSPREDIRPHPERDPGDRHHHDPLASDHLQARVLGGRSQVVLGRLRVFAASLRGAALGAAGVAPLGAPFYCPRPRSGRSRSAPPFPLPPPRRIRSRKAAPCSRASRPSSRSCATRRCRSSRSSWWWRRSSTSCGPGTSFRTWPPWWAGSTTSCS